MFKLVFVISNTRFGLPSPTWPPHPVPRTACPLTSLLLSFFFLSHKLQLSFSWSVCPLVQLAVFWTAKTNVRRRDYMGAFSCARTLFELSVGCQNDGDRPATRQSAQCPRSVRFSMSCAVPSRTAADFLSDVLWRLYMFMFQNLNQTIFPKTLQKFNFVLWNNNLWSFDIFVCLFECCSNVIYLVLQLTCLL